MNNADLGKAIADVTPGIIVDAVDELLLLQRAKTIGLAVTDEQFNGVLDSIKKDNKIESEEAFQAALKQEGMTLPQLRKMLEKRMLISQVRQREVMAHVDITEAEEKAYYDAHTGGVRVGAQRHAARNQGDGSHGCARRQRRRRRRCPQKKAEDTRARLVKGERSTRWRRKSPMRRRRPTAG